MHTLLTLGIIFVLGSFMKWVSAKLKILNVVGYLILGFIIGPQVLGLVSYKFIEDTHSITDVALSLIAVFVGANLRYNIIQEYWKQIAIVSLFETLLTFTLVTGGFYIFFDYLGLSFAEDQRLSIALLFGGLSAATAPATVLAVIHELRAKGKFSSFLLSVVAADNAIALILFSLAMTVIRTLLDDCSYSLMSLLEVVNILVLSVVIGAIGAIISEIIDRFFVHYPSIKTTSTLGMILFIYGLSQELGLEPLLSSLVMGVVMANLSKEFFLVKKEFDNHLKDIIFLLFFTISAMHLDINFLFTMPIVVVVYVVFRILGKVIGVYIGGKISKSDKVIQKYLGLALFPQAGIAIGLALSLSNIIGFEQIAPIMLNAIIATTMVHELLGPLFTTYVVKLSGEARVAKDSKKNR